MSEKEIPLDLETQTIVGRKVPCSDNNCWKKKKKERIRKLI